MRLLYVSHSFPPRDRPQANVGGMQRVATELHDALAAHPAVQLHSLLLRTSWKWTHVRMVPFGAALLRQIPAVVRTERIEAVLFSSMVTAAVTLPVHRQLRAAGVALAAVPVGRDVTLPVAPYQWLVPKVLRSLDRIFPISRATAAECIARGAAADQLSVIPCGVDPARFPPLGDRRAARASLLEAVGAAGEVSPDDLLLFSVGRHVERKGFVWFVDRVMPRLPPQIRFWLAGEGPTTPEIRDAVARHRLEGRVRLLGKVSDELLGKLYRGTDLFVMPNVPVPGDMEGFGVVMLEAGMSGLPTIAAALEGITDAVREGENGHLVPTGDAEAFADCILRYAADRDALAAASRRAARTTRSSFAWPALADRYVEALREVVPRRRGAELER